MNYAEESLRLHGEWKGKIEVVSRVPVQTKEDLSLAYTPGVAQPCLEIQKDIDKSYELTRRHNLCAVITDGSAVLGLGDIGPEAGMPVMEGKCVLFKAFGDVDAFPLCVKTKDVDEFVNTVLNESGLINQMDKETEEEYVTRKENLMEFVGAAREYMVRAGEDERTLASFLENVALITDLDRQEEAPQFVTMMTLHSAKGLEYDTVFIAGMEENVFPSYRAINEDDRLEEERRLAYVGITRARKQLCLTLARQRTIFNQVSYNRPSRFISEIPQRLIEDVWALSRQHFGAEQTPIRKPHSREPRPTDFGTPGMGQLNIPGVTRGIVPSQASRLSGSALMKMYQPGDRVMHRKFGEGTVVSVEKAGTDARISIEFIAYGTKEFSLAIAPIFKIEE